VKVEIITNVADVATRLDARAAAMRDLTPALNNVAAEIDRMTAQAFTDQESPAGAEWPGLADATLIARLRQRKSAYRKAVGGKKSKRTPAQRRQAVLDSARSADFKPLVNTGRLRASARAKVAGGAIIWSIAAYGPPHMAGGKGGRPPLRNPSVFERSGGSWRVHRRIVALLERQIAAHVARATMGVK
jgi:phage gpG-like protein